MTTQHNKKLFIACHNDDEALFGAYTLMREKPLVVVVTDGITHKKRFGIDPKTRRAESIKACNIARVSVQFLGLPDDKLKKSDLKLHFSRLKGFSKIYAPALDGGNPVHDMVSEMAWYVWGDKVTFYTTYSRVNFHIKGDVVITPTKRELEKKRKMPVKKRWLLLAHLKLKSIIKAVSL